MSSVPQPKSNEESAKLIDKRRSEKCFLPPPKIKKLNTDIDIVLNTSILLNDKHDDENNASNGLIFDATTKISYVKFQKDKTAKADPTSIDH